MILSASILYAIAMGVLLLYGASHMWMALVLTSAERARPGHVPPHDVTVPAADATWPLVTVQIPLYNEELVAARIIDSCAALEYPRLRLEIQVLDDSTDGTTTIVAAAVDKWRERGVNIFHIRRPGREGYKAGALQNGLRFASGDFIAVFDADFVPAPDFLARLMPRFDADDVGMVQARWGHLNADNSMLTKMQSFGLDAHFAVEQRVRNETGCFMNFNGTAGIWRRACIEAAGGWMHDTLTEDLDLSYRAQLQGWRFVYDDDVQVDAELPADMNGFRTQQFRWTKGATQSAMKLLPSVWNSSIAFGSKVAATFHLTAHVVYPAVLVAVVLHAPLLYAAHRTGSPGEMYFALMGLGLAGFGGFFLAQAVAQRRLYPDWKSRLRVFPLFVAGTIGLAASNAMAVFEAMAGRRSAFVRTPKYNATAGENTRWWATGYARAGLPPIVYVELALFLYSLAGAVAIAAIVQLAALPFQLLFSAGFGMIVWFTFRHHFIGSRSTTGASRGDLAARPA